MPTFRVGFDLGNVILIDSHTPSAECIEILAKIVDLVGRQNAYILSKAFRKRQHKSLALLKACDFFMRTGILPQNVFFTLDRKTHNARPLGFDDLRPVMGAIVEGPRYAPAGFGKGALTRLLGIHLLLDDKEDCLLDVADNSGAGRPKLLQALFTAHAKPSNVLEHVHCNSWTEVELQIRSEFFKCKIISGPILIRSDSESEPRPRAKKMPRLA